LFTGIVEEIGTVRTVTPRGSGRVLDVRAPHIAPDLKTGASVAVAGACQTVLDADANGFRVAAESETLRVTTLGALAPGDPVNLERALAAGGRFDGHIVLGHVDATARVVATRTDGTTRVLELEVGAEARPFVVPKGCIAVDGVSLTVGPRVHDGTFELYLIPYTWEHTTLHRLQVGHRVNIETDVLGRYVAHLIGNQGSASLQAGGAAGAPPRDLDWDTLQRAFGGDKP
jgi:riboflavin synthase